jgi:hypothetical protein
MSENNKQIVKNASKGYNYKYSNLADLARAGVEIPPMRTERVDGYEYVFAKVGNEWIQGARVVELTTNGMNPAQAYGAALTYARRYTVQLVQAIACDDDDALEAHTAEDRKNFSKAKTNYGIDFDEVKEALEVIDDAESLKAYYEEIKAKNLSDKQMAAINRMFNQAKGRLNEK